MTLQRPAYLQARGPRADLSAKLAAGLGVAQPPRISLKDDRFTLYMANGDKHPTVQPSLSLDVIVVGGNGNASKILYDTYDPDNPGTPICWSDNGVGPSERSSQPQSETCANCPQNVWGSKISAMGSKVQACATVKKIAVLVAGAGDTVFLLQIPPASLKPWRNYIAHLQNLDQTEATEVITRIKLESKTLSFEPVDFVPEALLPSLDKIIESDEPAIVTGERDRPRQGALPPPAHAPAAQLSPPPAPPAPGPSFGAPRPAAVSPALGAGFGIESPQAPPPAAEPTAAEKQIAALQEQLKAMQATAAAQTSAPAAAPARRRGRQPAGAVQAGETVVAAGPVPPTTFLAPGTAEPAAAPAPAAFGVQGSPPPPPAGLQAALDKAFGKFGGG